MNLKECLLVKNACYLRGESITPRGVMVHSTGANNPRLSRYVQPDDGELGVNKYGNHWNIYTPDGRKICPHAFIGLLADGVSVATYQTLPFNFKGWHSGTGSKGSANDLGYIGFEICEDGLRDRVYFEAVYREATEFCAYLCNKYGLNPFTDIIDHKEGHALGIASNHGDVAHWFKKFGATMDDLRAEVVRLLNDGKPEGTGSKLYRVKLGAYLKAKDAQLIAEGLKNRGVGCFTYSKDGRYFIQLGAFKSKENAERMAKVYRAELLPVFIDLI